MLEVDASSISISFRACKGGHTHTHFMSACKGRGCTLSASMHARFAAGPQKRQKGHTGRG
eukprot:1160436-Pelagomonas_calceolata.AAC.18